MKLKLALGALGAATIVAFLYVKTQNIDLEQHEAVRQALGELTDISSRLSEDVLKLRCSLLTNYDSVAGSQRRSLATLERLEALYGEPRTPGEQDILAGISACKAAFTVKSELAEEFKSQSVVLDNSLDYLPTLGYSLATSDLGNPDAAQGIEDLLRDTLVYHRNGQKDLVSRIGALIGRLQELRTSLRPDHQRSLEFMIAHVKSVIRTKALVENLLGRIAAVPIAKRIEQLGSSISHEYAQGVRSAALYRRMLLILSFILLVGIAVALVKLHHKAGALAGANRTLEVIIHEVAGKEAQNRAILEGAADGILSLDDQGRLQSMNPTAERLFGLDSKSSTGRSFESLVSSSWDAMKARLGAKQETLGKAKDGSFVSLELVLTGIDVAGRKMFIVLLQDITERKRVDRLKDEFVSTVSHELRTPLTSIRGSLGLIAHGVLGALPPQAKNMLDIAAKNCDRLVGLVNDILDVEKITSGKMVLKMKALELYSVLSQAVEVNRPFAESCGVQLSFAAADPALVVYGDQDRLMQVLTNLISNACKFSPRGAAVTLQLGRVAGKVRASVSDRGPGIPEEFRSRIFQKFAQAAMGDSSGKKGTGLGLAISKAFVELMGGSIGFSTETGKGTTFFIDLEERKLEVARRPRDPAGPGS